MITEHSTDLSWKGESPFFSIIIPTYNRAHIISKTLDSVFKQRFESFELIVVDDGSTDNTAFVVGKYRHPKLSYYLKENGERAAARNFGITKAKGKYVTFCDSDDLLFEDYLLNAYETLNNKPGIPWMHLGYEIQRRRGIPLKMTWMSRNFIYNLAKGNPLSCMGVFVKKEIIDENLFNQNRHLSGSEDWELWLRLSAKYPIVFDQRVSSILVAHSERSVIQTGELKLLLRKFLSIGYAFDDADVQKVFGGYRKMMEAYFDTYIALHLLLEKNNMAAFKYIWQGFRKYPTCIFERRFMAIVKHFFLNAVGTKQ